MCPAHSAQCVFIFLGCSLEPVLCMQKAKIRPSHVRGVRTLVRHGFSRELRTPLGWNPRFAHHDADCREERVPYLSFLRLTPQCPRQRGGRGGGGARHAASRFCMFEMRGWTGANHIEAFCCARRFEPPAAAFRHRCVFGSQFTLPWVDCKVKPWEAAGGCEDKNQGPYAGRPWWAAVQRATARQGI